MEQRELFVELKGPTTQFAKEGPRFIDVLQDLEGRENPVQSFDRPSAKTDWRKPVRSFSEADGLIDLGKFLDKTMDLATQAGDEKVREETALFAQNLVFIGEKELREATAGIADHLVETASLGVDCAIYVHNVRSERYIALRVMEEFDRLTDDRPELKRKVKITRMSDRAVELCLQNPDNSRLVVVDDFAVSGTRIRGAAEKAANGLVEGGMAPEKAAEITEACLVACPKRSNGTAYEILLKNGNQDSARYPLRVFSYFSAQEYYNTEGKWAVYPGVSLTGTHSSVDYGFEEEVEQLVKQCQKQGVEPEVPLLCNIIRPYKTVEDPALNQFADSDLQTRWEKVGNKFGFEPEEFKRY